MDQDLKREPNLSFFDIIKILLSKKRLIISITISAAIGSVIYSLQLPNIYTSKALLAPISKSDSLSQSVGGYSGVASLAGFNFLSSENATRVQEALDRLESLDFFSNEFLPLVNLEDLYAVKKWDPYTNTITYDNDIFFNGKWIREVDFPFKPKPSPQESYEVYLESLIVNLDNDTGFVTLKFNHKSPFIAHEWLTIIIDSINKKMRTIDQLKSTEAIEFLNEQTKITNQSALKDAISSLLENQMEVLMMAAINSDYVFKIIDSPQIPELKSSPNRAFICILGTILGAMFASILSLVLHFKREFN